MGVLISLFFGVFLVAVLMVEDVEKQSNFDHSFLSFPPPHKPSESLEFFIVNYSSI